MFALRERFTINSDEYNGIIADRRPDDPRQSRKLRPMFFVGAAFELRLTDLIHIFAVVDYAPAQDPRERALCGGDWTDDGCDHWMPGNIAIEGRAGIGLRFF